MVSVPSCPQCFVQHGRWCVHPGSAFPCIGLCSSGRGNSACFGLVRVDRRRRQSLVVLVHLDRSCCLVACFFSGRSAELSGTGACPDAFVYFRSGRQSRVRDWPQYISNRLAFVGILLCTGGSAFCELMVVALRSAVVWGPPLGQRCLQGTRVSASVKGRRSLVFHCLFRQLCLCML